MRDGAPIIRQRDESLAQAAERQGRPVSMFWSRAPILQDLGTAMEKQHQQEQTDEESDQESEKSKNGGADEFDDQESELEGDFKTNYLQEEDGELMEEISDEEFEYGQDEPNQAPVPEEEDDSEEDETGLHTFQVWTAPKNTAVESRRVYEAERSIPTTRVARKAAFDGVLMPPLKFRPSAVQTPGNEARAGRKDKRSEAPFRTKSANIPEPEKSVKTGKPKKAGEAPMKPSMNDVPEIQPYDARKIRVRPLDDKQDVEMPDVQDKKYGSKENNPPSRPVASSSPLQRKQPRGTLGMGADGRPRPEVSETVRQIHKRCMNAHVDTTVGELYELSKDLRTTTLQNLRTKIVKAVMLTRDRRAMVAHVAEYPWFKEDGVLIKIDMEVSGQPVVAVIDTGSQLDAIREGVAERILRQPVDLTKAIQMNDANGGEKTITDLEAQNFRTFLVIKTEPVDANSNETRRPGVSGLDSVADGQLKGVEDARQYKEGAKIERVIEERFGDCRGLKEALMADGFLTLKLVLASVVLLLTGLLQRRVADAERVGIRAREYKTLLGPSEPTESLSLLLSTLTCLSPRTSLVFSVYFFMLNHALCPPSLSATPSRAAPPLLSRPSSDSGDEKRVPLLAVTPRRPDTPITFASTPRRPDTPMPPVSSGGNLPKYELVSNAHSRMIKVQFLNRDTYGTIGDVNRLPMDGTAYQLLYDLPGDVRQRYQDGEVVECRPIAVSSAQSEYLGKVRDMHGRESHRFQAINSSLDGYDSETGRPFKIVGDVSFEVYVPPGSPGLPWALEAPYPARTTIQEVLGTYDAHQRPFYAFPTNSTSLRPALDYLQPQPTHPPGINPIIQPAPLPPQLPNHPRIQYCMPPIEADAYEVGRAIHNSIITHALWQQTPTYRWHEYGPQDHIPEIEKNWEYMGNSEDGYSRWREPLPMKNYAFPTSQPVEYREDPIPFNEEELPDVPDDTEVLFAPSVRYEFNSTTCSRLIHSRISARILNEVPQNLADLTVVQVPDPNDQFSRPVPRYVIPEQHEEEFERMGRIAADLARDVRRGQRARRRFPLRFATPGRIRTLPALLENDADLELEGRGRRQRTHYSFSDSDEGSSSEEDPAAKSTSEEDDYIPPARPLESDSSYFPLMPPQRNSSTDSVPSLQSASSSSNSLRGSSSEESFLTASSDDIILYDTALQYLPETPSSFAEALRATPPQPSSFLNTPPIFSLESPLHSPGSLQTVPETTSFSPSMLPRPSLAHYAHAALATAERALNTLKSSLTVPTIAGTSVMRELEECVNDLERATSTTPTPQHPQNERSRFPLDEDFEGRMTASDRLAHQLADALRDPQIYRVQFEPLTIDPALLLAPSALDDIAQKVKDGFRITPDAGIPDTPCPSPLYSPTFSHSSLGSLAGSTGGIQPLTEEEQRMMEDIFEFFSDDGAVSITPSSLSSSELEAAGTLINELQFKMIANLSAQETLFSMRRPPGRRSHYSDPEPPSYDGVEDMFALDMDEAPMETSSEPPNGAPPSRCPTRNDCGMITYNRRQFGWHDYQYGVPPWPRAQRERSEAIGYALEFPDRFILFSRATLGKLLFPNLQLQHFRHTDRRLRLEAAQRASRRPIAPHFDQRLPLDEYPDARRHPRLPHCDPEMPEFILNDLGDDDSDTESEASLPEELMTVVDMNDISLPFLRFYKRLQTEHALRTSLTTITRSSRYSPSPLHHAPMPMDYLRSDDLPMPKRRKTQAHEIPLTRRIMCAEALNATIRYWREHLEHLQSMRSDVAFTIQRLIEVIEWLGLQAEFRRIFFPFEEAFPITTVFQMYAMERMHNPDGFFRRNTYHLNSILHDAECNFLQACAILFRQTGDYELAYTLEELVSTRIRDDTGVMQLLREGFIDSHYEITAAFFNDGYGRIADRIEEVAEDYPCGEPEFRATFLSAVPRADSTLPPFKLDFFLVFGSLNLPRAQETAYVCKLALDEPLGWRPGPVLIVTLSTWVIVASRLKYIKPHDGTRGRDSGTKHIFRAARLQVVQSHVWIFWNALVEFVFHAKQPEPSRANDLALFCGLITGARAEYVCKSKGVTAPIRNTPNARCKTVKYQTEVRKLEEPKIKEVSEWEFEEDDEWIFYPTVVDEDKIGRHCFTAYKRVDRKVKPVPTTFPTDSNTIRNG
ncbi:hypothetical protein FB451DRAFT_1196862 [Mycena latifolia]|nr:hypothetical protein FB451DRAFT_1196862 [Mycena latifolia]